MPSGPTLRSILNFCLCAPPAGRVKQAFTRLPSVRFSALVHVGYQILATCAEIVQPGP